MLDIKDINLSPAGSFEAVNSVDSGNEIIFPNIGYKYSPVEGDMLSWVSGDKDSIHEVPSVTETRYSMPIWVTDNPKYKLNYEMI